MQTVLPKKRRFSHRVRERADGGALGLYKFKRLRVSEENEESNLKKRNRNSDILCALCGVDERDDNLAAHLKRDHGIEVTKKNRAAELESYMLRPGDLYPPEAKKDWLLNLERNGIYIDDEIEL